MATEVTTEPKKWGLYNTFDNPELLDTLDEIDIWKKIDNLGGAIFQANHDAADNRPWAANISMTDLMQAQYNLEFLVYYTKKFGVEFSREPSETEHVERSASYNAWFQFWHDHFKSMSPEVYDQFVEDKFSGKDISKYMPTGSWKDLLEQSSSRKS